MWWELSTQILDSVAAFLVLPAVVGSARLERARQWTATRSSAMERWAALFVRGAALTAFAAIGFVGFMLSTMKGRTLVTGKVPSQGSLVFWSAVLLICASAAHPVANALGRLTRVTVRGALWLPARIARSTPLAHILAGVAFSLFVVARAISIATIVVDDGVDRPPTTFDAPTGTEGLSQETQMNQP